MKTATASATTLAIGILMATAASGCSSAPDESASTTTTATPTVALRLAWPFTPYDNSGLARENDSNGSKCYVPRLMADPQYYFYNAVMDGKVVFEDQAGVIVGTASFPSTGFTSNVDAANGRFVCNFDLGMVRLGPADTYQVTIAGERWAVFSTDEISDTLTTITLRPPV